MFDGGREIVITECPGCSNKVEINKIWAKGGMNDYGGYAPQCGKCDEKVHLYSNAMALSIFVVASLKVITPSPSVQNKNWRSEEGSPRSHRRF